MNKKRTSMKGDNLNGSNLVKEFTPLCGNRNHGYCSWTYFNGKYYSKKNLQI